MADQDGGKLVYEVDIDTAKLLTGSQKAKAELASLGDAASGTTPGFDKLSNGAKGVSSALAMPEVNKLSNQLAQLSGKIGVSSDAAIDASVAQNKFSGALSTVAGKLGAGYVSNVGSATSSLIKHAKEAVAATSAQMGSAVAAQKEATALKSSAAQLVISAAAEKKQAEAAEATAISELKVAEAIFTRKQSEIESLEAVLARQKESLKQSEANLEISSSEKAVSDAVKSRSAVEATQAKILKQSNQATKEVTDAEDRVSKAKITSAAASQKVTQAAALEVVAKETVAKANDAAELATVRLTLAARAQTVAMVAARSALALLGGPAGVLLLAAAGVYSLYQAMSHTKEIEEFNKRIDDSIDKLDTLNNAQSKYAYNLFGEKIKSATKDVNYYAQEIALVESALRNNPFDINTEKNTEKLIQLKALYTEAKQVVLTYAEASDRAATQISKTTGLSAEQVVAQNALKDATKSLTEQNTLLARSILDGAGAAKDNIEIENFGKKLNQLGIYGDVATDTMERFASYLQQNKDFALAGAVEDTKQKVEELTIRLKEGEQAAIRFNAQMTVKNNGWDANTQDAKDYITNQQKIAALNKQISDQKNKASSDKSSAKRDANAAESVAQKLENLKQKADLAATSTQELSREQTILTAQQSLGKVATQNQIDLAGKYASQAWDTANAIKAQAAAEKLIPGRQELSRYTQESKDLKTALEAHKITRAEFNQATERAEQQHQINLARIKAEQAISPQQQALGEVNPLIQEQNEYAQRLALIQQFESAKTITAEQASQARQRILDEESAKQMQSIGTILGAASQGLDGIAGIIEASGGKASTAYKVMFGLSKGFAVAQAGINLQLALSQVLADPASLSPAQKFANYAAIASAGGSLVSTIGSIGYGGARKNGGPVSAGEMYRVGEGGAPEIYQAGTGKQYMIPGDNGKVISNKDMQGGSGGAGTVVQQEVHFHIETTNGIDDATMQKMAAMMKTVSLNTIKDQQRPNGLLRK
ncbi:hypothetical protein [Yersinia aleksiciae]|uniref:hypothetical protein n=1 Tax=Yersinia aleksiciae TaxID=263819 RepID=UPI001427DA0A|nr:hypothetical protein [Yersinia aleksiciae]MDA5496956.1 hypothetical protein [Yersinia aleksiciae]NIK98662.1 hypothetical protein [Yersinia aleksiciae]WQC72419.1 hypothetical protein N0K21_08430 [Yersinia aleksiciae]